MEKRRVVITGLGTVNPLGKRREPQLERLGLRRGNRLHQSEKLLYVSHIG